MSQVLIFLWTWLFLWKMRKLGIPTVVDRVVQQAISQVLGPIFEKQFSESSYGFRPGRSCEMAIIKSLEYINDGYGWIVDIGLSLNSIWNELGYCGISLESKT
ncbi:hypothetical protein COM35_14840 [Bacillus toyonensis]|nr:hypothetical protein COM35_14840 [Bacillus toyonensis]